MNLRAGEILLRFLYCDNFTQMYRIDFISFFEYFSKRKCVFLCSNSEDSKKIILLSDFIKKDNRLIIPFGYELVVMSVFNL